MRYSTEGLAEFLEGSASAYHAIEQIASMLEKSGFQKLTEQEKWKLEPGGKYYVTRNMSSIVSFILPDRGFAPFQITASHSDSPVFRIKQNAELEVAQKYIQLNVERYGGTILSTWLDRPLSIAGRLILRENDRYVSRLINIPRDCLLIPNLAIHMNREINDGYKFNVQKDLMPLYGDYTAKNTFDQWIAEEAGVSPEAIVGNDLYLYNRMKPTVWGRDNCYISAPRLDDLECAYTSLCGFLDSGKNENIRMHCVFDNEEVGSVTRQGAASTLLADIIQRIAANLGANTEELLRAIAGSFMVSADNAHAMHPNQPDKSDAVNHPFMNAGVVIKFSANQKYTTDGLTHAVFAEICKNGKVPVQYFANRSDMAGGGTLGNISGSQVSVPTLDIGCAQLAMHSSFETAGTLDGVYMAEALRNFYSTGIEFTGDAEFVLH